MDVDGNDLVVALTKQREVQATEAAMMAAACEGLKRKLASETERADKAEARLSELGAP